MIKRKRKLGAAFPDELVKVDARIGHSQKDNLGWEDALLPNYQPASLHEAVSVWRLCALVCLFIFAFTGLFIRLFHLQIVQGAENRVLADTNRVQIRPIHAPRGVIYDRNEKVLAENNPGFRLNGKFVSREDALKMEASSDPRFEQLEVDAIRAYPDGTTMSHVLGYVGEISEAELKIPKFQGYAPGDRVGRSGVEQAYESLLKGKDGAEIIEIDSSGKKLRTLRRVEPIPGDNIYLSLDLDLQRQVYQALAEGVAKGGSCCGAAVAENPLTGEILSLVSVPAFDANAFNDPLRSSETALFFTDPKSPLLNRVIGGTYPPGSTFKIVSALAGLSSGKITPATQIEDTGVMFLGPYKFSNWYFNEYGRTEGVVDIYKALQRSNDIYFYQVGQRVGEGWLGEVAKKIGFGKRLGIDVPGEVDGLIPDNSWKQKHAGESWYPGDTLHMAIGQGFVLVTPLQVLAETAFIASDGRLISPHLVTKVTSAYSETLKQFHYEPIVKDIFKKEDLAVVKKGLSLVPKPGGTAWPFFNFSIPTAGKTGTAEFGDPKNKTHAWYTSFAPENNPSLALTVLVEASGEGSSIAGPISKQIYNWYFNPDKAHLVNLDNNPIASASAKSLGE